MFGGSGDKFGKLGGSSVAGTVSAPPSTAGQPLGLLLALTLAS